MQEIRYEIHDQANAKREGWFILKLKHQIMHQINVNVALMLKFRLNVMYLQSTSPLHVLAKVVLPCFHYLNRGRIVIKITYSNSMLNNHNEKSIVHNSPTKYRQRIRKTWVNYDIISDHCKIVELVTCFNILESLFL